MNKIKFRKILSGFKFNKKLTEQDIKINLRIEKRGKK